jgi:hypothetical protein
VSGGCGCVESVGVPVLVTVLGPGGGEREIAGCAACAARVALGAAMDVGLAAVGKTASTVRLEGAR